MYCENSGPNWSKLGSLIGLLILHMVYFVFGKLEDKVLISWGFFFYYAYVLSFINKPESKNSLFKYDLFLTFPVGEISGFAKQLSCIKISKAPNSPTRNTGSPLCIDK